MKYVGVDGCKAGWFAAWVVDGRWDVGVYADFGAVWAAHADAGTVLVDIPIGLSDTGARAVEPLVRQMLGPRRSSVFNTPARGAVHARTKEAAKAINRKASGKSLSEQSLGIMKKILEVDRFLQAHPEARERVLESHPEVCFARAAGQPMGYPKRDVPGVVERYEVLQRLVPDVRGLLARVRAGYPVTKVAGDDVFDALILAATARQGNLKSVPDPVEYDGTGLPMAVWYAEFESQ